MTDASPFTPPPGCDEAKLQELVQRVAETTQRIAAAGRREGAHEADVRALVIAAVLEIARTPPGEEFDHGRSHLTEGDVLLAAAGAGVLELLEEIGDCAADCDGPGPETVDRGDKTVTIPCTTCGRTEVE